MTCERWTNDEIADATYMAVVEKKSAAQIADTIGKTRNAVIGWANRNGVQLDGRESASPAKPAVKETAIAKRKPQPKMCRWPWHELRVGEGFGFAREDYHCVTAFAHYIKRTHGLVFRVTAKRGQPAFIERVA